MNVGGIKDTPGPPQPAAEQTPTDRIRTEFASLPEVDRGQLARDLFYGTYQLPPEWVGHLDSTIVGPWKQRLAANTAAQTPAAPNTTTETPTTIEDELVRSVKNTTFFGKFPKGLIISDKQIADPSLLSGGYQNYSRDGWRFSQYNSRNVRMGSFLEYQSHHPPFPETGFITEEPNPEEQGYTILTFGLPVDPRVVDHVGRRVGSTLISFNLPTEKAKAFIREVKTRPDGADLAERFLQLKVPEAFAKDPYSPGIFRARTTGLFVLDEEFQNAYAQVPKNPNIGSARNFQQYAREHAVVKPYSAPVGTSQTSPIQT